METTGNLREMKRAASAPPKWYQLWRQIVEKSNDNASIRNVVLAAVFGAVATGAISIIGSSIVVSNQAGQVVGEIKSLKNEILLRDEAKASENSELRRRVSELETARRDDAKLLQSTRELVIANWGEKALQKAAQQGEK